MRLTGTITFLSLLSSVWAECSDLGKYVIDEECNEKYPICVYRNGGEVVGGNTGHHCALCINSEQPDRFWQVSPDEGCNEEFRVCVGKRQLAANMEGTSCAKCFNSIAAALDPNDIDDGCPPQAPVCVNDAGKSPAIWKPGTNCVAKCANTSPYDKDKGCPWQYPVCVLKDGTEPAQGKGGVKCAACSASTCDDGNPCTDDICDPEWGCYYVDNGTCTCGEDASDWQCWDPIFFSCSQTNFCVCDIDTEGSPFCWPSRTCEGLTNCTSSEDCEGNTRCATTCCADGGGVCIEPCEEYVEPESLRAREGPTTTGL